MKNLVSLIAVFLMCSSMIWAQHNVFSVGAAQTLTITGGTVFSADSLVLKPAANFTIASNAVLETPVPVPGAPTSSITRVYYLNAPITFTGTLQIYYQLSELNGNTESLLKYSDSSVGRVWLVSGSSTVNTVAHFVQQVTNIHTFNGVTANQSGSPLSLTMLSFTGYWDGDHVALTWSIDQTDGAQSFTVESSYDGQTWKEVATIAGSPEAGQYKYSCTDWDTDFTTRLYRIKMIELSEQVSYSSIIKISKADNVNTVYVVEKNNGATIIFRGAAPNAVRVMNSTGQTIWQDNTSRNQYELNSVPAGIYFVQYELNGQVGVKEFMVQ